MLKCKDMVTIMYYKDLDKNTRLLAYMTKYIKHSDMNKSINTKVE